MIKRIDILSRFRSDLASQGRIHIRSLQYKALKSFESFNTNPALTSDDFTREYMSEWVAWLFYEGYSKSTVLAYLKALSSMYNKAVGNSGNDSHAPILAVRNAVRDLPDRLFTVKPNRLVLPALQRLVSRSATAAPDLRLACDILLFAVMMGGLTTARIAGFTKTDYTGDDPLITDIIERNARPRFRHLFPLRQTLLSPARLDEEIAAMMGRALAAAGLHPTLNPLHTAAELWSLAAYECSGSFAKALACAAHKPEDSLVFSLIRPDDTLIASEDFAAESEHLRSRVRTAIYDDPVRWHVMQLRRRVSFDEVHRRLRQRGLTHKLVSVYNPIEEVARRVGKKTIYRQRELLPGIIFFLCRESDIRPIFREIGDLAWCYRRSRDADSPYAIVPDREMELLRLTIGDIPADAEIILTGPDTFQAGDNLQILSGMMADRFARVTIVEHKGTRTLYHIEFIGGTGLRWTIPSTSLHARRLPTLPLAQ